MEVVHLFQTNEDFENTYYGEKYKEPWLSYTIENESIGFNKTMGAVTGVSLNKGTLTLAVGQTEQLQASVLPPYASDTSVTWTSSNQSIATVNASGLVTAISNGSATITVTTNDGGFSAQCTTTVKLAGSVTVVPEVITGLTYDGTALTLVTAGSGTGTMMYKLNDGSWSETIPSVTDAGTYAVYYKAAESAEYAESSVGGVVVTVNKADRTMSWVLQPSEIIIGGTDNASATTTGDGTISYGSDDENVATIDSVTGEIIAITTGTCTISATISASTNYNSGLLSYTLSVIPEEPVYKEMYFTTEVLSDGVLKFRNKTGITVEYRINGGEWTTYTTTITGAPINVVSGDVVEWRGNNASYATSHKNSGNFCTFGGTNETDFLNSGSTAMFNVYGNIMSLVYGDNFIGQTALTGTYNFAGMFNRCYVVVSAEHLILPAMTLTPSCYRAMFSHAHELTVMPDLPATTLADNCYSYAIEQTKITKTCVLPAEVVPTSGYYAMFIMCSGLSEITCLATNTAATTCTANWVSGVAETGVFCKNPSMTGWTKNSVKGIPCGWTVMDYGFTIADYAFELDLTGGNATTRVSSAGANWTASTSDSWLSVSPTTGSSGDIFAEIRVASGNTSRTGTVTFTDGTETKVVNIKQEAQNVPYSAQYLTFDVISAGTIVWKCIGGTDSAKTISYSVDNGQTWSAITSTAEGVEIGVSAGDKVLVKGTNNTYAKDKSNYTGFQGGTAYFSIKGNIMSLIGGDNFTGTTAITKSYAFASLFKLSNVVSAKYLVLPVMTLYTSCYRAMFSFATSLVDAPILPATTLARDCYWYMFEGTAISTAPVLPATTLVQGSYGGMFSGCSKLNYIECYATDISASACTNGWVSQVAPIGTFVKDSSMEDWTIGISGIPVGWVTEAALVEPAISCDGEEVTITCGTPNAEIYYSLNQSGNYTLYTDPIIITANTIVSAYSQKGGKQSEVISQNCVYNPMPAYSASNLTLGTWTYGGNSVTVPYSVNRTDGHSNNYAKGTFDFETTVTLKKTQPTLLWFQHADQSAQVYVDNNLVEKHWGGYNAFFMDISSYAHSGSNTIKVTLKNNEGNNLAPSTGDFNYNATLGEVKLFTSPVIPSAYYGYDGFHVLADVATSSATINIKTTIPTGATVTCEIDDGTYHFGSSADSTGNEMIFSATVVNPHLWHGKTDPHLYNITLRIYHDGELYHQYIRPYGLRFFDYAISGNTMNGETGITYQGADYTGFLLNGQPYFLRGVCMHDDLDGKANALNSTDYSQEFSIIQELGCNFIRLAHYPHPKEVYDRCDQLGIIVQTEVPCVNRFNTPETEGTICPQAYYDHLDIQYADMVEQHFNHPCIMFWGLFNEGTTNDSAWAKTKLEYYKTLIKTIDPSRWVGYVVSASYSNPSSTFGNPDMDWFGCNYYQGWYQNNGQNNGTLSNDPTSALNTRVNNIIRDKHKPLAYSEYGAGGTQSCHSIDCFATTTRGNYERHDIEYQMWLHEGHIAAIRDFPNLLFTGEWQLFDIAVSKRNEGYVVCADGVTSGTNDDLRYLNDKGLVERDHVTKKDTFYLYKAEWNKTDKFVHICGKDYTNMTDRVIKCYTNESGPFALYVDGTQIGSTVSPSNNILEFPSTGFTSGNVVVVSGGTVSDTFTFD